LQEIQTITGDSMKRRSFMGALAAVAVAPKALLALAPKETPQTFTIAIEPMKFTRHYIVVDYTAWDSKTRQWKRFKHRQEYDPSKPPPAVTIPVTFPP
jgi:hypothetical protein